MHSFAFLAVLSVASLAFVRPSAAAAQSDRPDLAGTWVLNRGLSDSPDSLEVEDPPRTLRIPRVGGVGVRVGGMPPVGSDGGFGRPRGFDPLLMREAVAAVKVGAERVFLSMNGDTLLIGAGESAPYALVVNGRKTKRPWMDGVVAEIRASWKDRQLRIERKLPNGLKITDSYSIDPDTERLVVVTSADGPIPREVELRRVYDRATDSP